MQDSRTILTNAVRQMDNVVHRYENGEDTLPLVKRLVRLQRMLKQARRVLIRERVEALLTKTPVDRKDKETIEELFGAILQTHTQH